MHRTSLVAGVVALVFTASTWSAGAQDIRRDVAPLAPKRSDAARITTPQIDLTTFASTGAVAPGNRFTLTLTVTPHAGMHVYALGAAGYRTVGLKIAPTKYVRVLPLTYPRAEVYEFKPLKE